jgi:hypothetical protein
MGLFKKAMVVGVAKKVFDEARKPHNQKKIKDAYASFQARRTGQSPSAPSTQPPPGGPAAKPTTDPR